MKNKKNATKYVLSKELAEALKSAVKDEMTQRTVVKTEQGMLLNDLLLKRKKGTLVVYRVPCAYFEFDSSGTSYVRRIKYVNHPENRLFRLLPSRPVTVNKKVIMKLKSGKVLEFEAEYTYRELIGWPVLFVKFEGRPLFTNGPREKAWRESEDMIRCGIAWMTPEGEKVIYEYAQSSASEMRTLKGMFIRRDFHIPDEYLAKFKPTGDIREFGELMDTLKSLRGPEALYTMISYGAYIKDFRGRENSPAQFMTRMGAAQTSTKSLGNSFRVRQIGEVKFPWTNEVEEEHKILFENSLVNERVADRVIKAVKRFWKEEKYDGQSMMRASAVIRGFANLSIKLYHEDVIGRLVQFRWAGVKGTALVVPDECFDLPQLPDGSYPYRNYDIIVEKNSWKYSPWVKYWNGELMPDFELVAMSRERYTQNSNYQYLLALDGNKNMVEILKRHVDKWRDNIMAALQDPVLCKASMGIKSYESYEDGSGEISLDRYDSTLTTLPSKALDACDSIVHDITFRNKYISRLFRDKDELGYGKLPVEGAYRFIISDPTGFFRTDLAVPRMKDGKVELDYEGNPMFDIVVTSTEQMALRGITSAYWCGKHQEAVLFRSPCVSPGEPQRVNLVGLDVIPDAIRTSYGDINIRGLFECIRDLVVVNCFSYTLDALGGADTDGDTVLIVTDPAIVSLRNTKRPPTLIKVTSTKKLCVINPDNIKQYMIESLVDAGIGRITNWATTWRDIELMVLFMPNPDTGKYKLPSVVAAELSAVAKKAEKWLRKNYETIKSLCLESLVDISDLKDDADDKTEDWAYHVVAARATAAMKGINSDDFNSWAKLVVAACEANITLLRRLQETAINTAKSGVFVDFSMCPWVQLQIRARWHRPSFKVTYNSWSTLGQLAPYVDGVWKEIREWTRNTSVPVELGIDIAPYKEQYNIIREIKGRFGQEVGLLFDSNNEETAEMSRDERMRMYREISAKYNLLLRSIAADIGSIDVVTALVYQATLDRNDSNEEGLSFIWACWGEEFVATLRHLNSDKKTKRLVVVHMLKEFMSYTLPSGKYIVQDEGLRFLEYPELVVATVSVPDGAYEVINYNETPYLLIEMTRPKVDQTKVSLKGTKIFIIGMKHFGLTRDDVKSLIKEAGYTIIARYGTENYADGKTFTGIMFFVDIPGKGEVRIGNMPTKGSIKEEHGFLTKALGNKKIRVIIPYNADKEDRNKDGSYSKLTVEIVEETDLEE